MAKIVVIGDVGGCVRELVDALVAYEHDPDVVVVQVGDLVDRGPDSRGVLELVGARLGERPRRWIQLIGNHEWQYLDDAVFWPEPLGDGEVATLRTWWMREWVRVAAAVRTAEGEEFLLTHAGLTAASWRALDGPVTAATAADLLNTRPEELLRDYDGPLWAAAGSQLYPSWQEGGRPVPFGQIHGHSSVVDFNTRTWRCGERLRERTEVDWEARHTVTRIGGSRFVGVDPKHGTTGAPAWAPLVLEGATLL
ncbi:metallophosphoesterase [Winogradskya humida]|uniref:Calcineurin-like phosphoesterase domain-containing protein n=1 Tax=Winogradskya humida TaxID=113566 RepID=A0ABQ3ZJ77_9ACTN|nr:metallophosphoesterase [Actinoplanes humidus]GIE18277.1 hypothetical protein Ahu01nite_013790 [Actinoplanes humidus]